MSAVHADNQLLPTLYQAFVIVLNRQICDQALKSVAGVGLFISSVTAVFDKPTEGEVTGFILPALAYWIVVDSDIVSRESLMMVLHDVCPGSRIKLFGSGLWSTSENASICSSLYIVLKDHNSDFIRLKMLASLMYHDMKQSVTSLKIMPSHIIVNNKIPYLDIVQNAMPYLQQSKLAIDLQL